jgi:hypothetical protein
MSSIRVGPKERDALFDMRRRGGRHHQHLSVEEEIDCWPTAKAQAGGLLHVSGQAMEKKVGGRAPSTVYRMSTLGGAKSSPTTSSQQTCGRKTPLKKLRVGTPEVGRQAKRAVACD